MLLAAPAASQPAGGRGGVVARSRTSPLSWHLLHLLPRLLLRRDLTYAEEAQDSAATATAVSQQGNSSSTAAVLSATKVRAGATCACCSAAAVGEAQQLWVQCVCCAADHKELLPQRYVQSE